MRYLFFILIIVISKNKIYGQSKDSLIILNEISFKNNVIDCKNYSGRPLCSPGVISTKDDSLQNCYYAKTFKTNKRNIYYQKEYNILNVLIAEGEIRSFKNKGIERKFEKSFYKISKWKEYNYKDQKIHILDYVLGKSEGTYVSTILGDEVINMINK